MNVMNRFKDARDFQIMFLCLFLILGVWTRDWTLRFDMMVVVVLSCLLSQWMAECMVAGEWKKPVIRSALITALSLCLLLRVNHYSTMVFAGTFSILSKFIFRFRGKHFFNPSNFGIVAAILFTRDAWVTPGQWGEDIWYVFVFMATGGMVVNRVGRWDTTGAFLGCYGFLEFLRHIWLGWGTWDVLAHRLTGGSLLLFSFFMITDPRAIPDARVSRVLWSICVALLTFILRNFHFIPTAMFWSLFVLSPFTIVFDMIWKKERFSWTVPASLKHSKYRIWQNFTFKKGGRHEEAGGSFCSAGSDVFHP